MAVMTSITRTWEGKVWSTTSRRAEHASSFAGPGTCHFSQGKARERPSEGNFSSGAMSWLDRPVASFTCSFVSGCSVFLRVGSHGLGSFPSRANVPYRTKRRKRVREKTTTAWSDPTPRCRRNAVKGLITVALSFLLLSVKYTKQGSTQGTGQQSLICIK